ncbi:MAG: prolyl oligopeptidase family serine peptidase [Chitinophagaceae bacterium]|nr:prolyl oligopeptidase family serine peptidase [Chitinophagaceae bacterium]
MGYGSIIFWATQGYAIMDNTEFPIVGEGDKQPNDNFVEQLTWSAEAAINKIAEMGVGDSTRVAVGGHSYGAFMTANLLAHTKLFKAGIARSGAYNRTLTPFGFQNEERTYWMAPEVYFNMSPFSFANQIKTPLLMIHGEADNNPGTFPIQSERLYNAIKGHAERSVLCSCLSNRTDTRLREYPAHALGAEPVAEQICEIREYSLCKIGMARFANTLKTVWDTGNGSLNLHHEKKSYGPLRHPFAHRFNDRSCPVPAAALQLYNEGIKLKDNRQTAEALDKFKKAIAIKANYTDALYNAGWCQNELAKYNSAIDYLNKARVGWPDIPKVYFELGFAFYKLGNNDSARIHFNRCLELKKDYSLAFKQLGYIDYDEEKYSSAIGQFNQYEASARTRSRIISTGTGRDSAITR